MPMHDRLYRYTVPLMMAGAIATAPAIVLGAQAGAENEGARVGTEQGAPTPQVTPTPPADRNIGEETDRGYQRSEMEPTDRVGTESDAPTPQVTPSPPAERNIGQDEPGTAADMQEAMRPDEDDDESTNTIVDEEAPSPSVTPTPPAERNIEQERGNQGG